MQPSESSPQAAAARPSIEAAGPGPGPRPPASGRALVGLAAAAGLVAGGLAWALGETPAVAVEPVEVNIPVMGSGPLMPSTTPEAEFAAQRQTAARALGVLGALTGLLLGLAGGAAIGSRGRALRAGGAGLVLGGVVAAGVAWAALTAFEGWRAGRGDDLVLSLLQHGTCWAPIGAIGGLALALGLGLGLRDRAPAGLVGGVVGALLATVLYEVLGAVLFPMAGTGELIAGAAPARLLAMVLVPTLAALGAASAVLRAPGRPGAASGATH